MILPPSFSFPVPELTPQESEIEVLRSLGRFEFLTTDLIGMLHFPLPLGLNGEDVYRAKNRQNVQVFRILTSLYKKNLCWRIPSPGSRRQSRGRPPYIYGLSHAGRDMLANLDIEDSTTISTLKSRPHTNPNVGIPTLNHDLVAATWSSGLVHILRHIRRIHQIFVQVEYTTKGQRFDAFVMLRLWRNPLKIHDYNSTIPWWEAVNLPTNLVETLGFAVEVDMGTEREPIIKEKAERYFELTRDGYYQQQMGIDVMPIFLVPSPERVLSIMTAWNKVWRHAPASLIERCPAVVSVQRQSYDQKWGPVWGRYIDIARNKPVALLHPLGCTSKKTWEQEWVKKEKYGP